MELTSEVFKQYGPIEPVVPPSCYLLQLLLSSTLGEPPQ